MISDNVSYRIPPGTFSIRDALGEISAYVPVDQPAGTTAYSCLVNRRRGCGKAYEPLFIAEHFG
jgi:hypothetical protein